MRRGSISIRNMTGRDPVLSTRKIRRRRSIVVGRGRGVGRQRRSISTGTEIGIGRGSDLMSKGIDIEMTGRKIVRMISMTDGVETKSKQILNIVGLDMIAPLRVVMSRTYLRILKRCTS